MVLCGVEAFRVLQGVQGFRVRALGFYGQGVRLREFMGPRSGSQDLCRVWGLHIGSS